MIDDKQQKFIPANEAGSRKSKNAAGCLASWFYARCPARCFGRLILAFCYWAARRKERLCRIELDQNWNGPAHDPADLEKIDVRLSKQINNGACESECELKAFAIHRHVSRTAAWDILRKYLEKYPKFDCDISKPASDARVILHMQRCLNSNRE